MLSDKPERPEKIVRRALLGVPVLLGSLCGAVQAEDAERSAEQSKEKDPVQDFQLIKTGVAQGRNLLGQTAAVLGIGLDSIFGSPDKNQPNESSIIIRTGIQFDDKGGASTVNGASFRADLPATDSKLQLLIRFDDRSTTDTAGTSLGDGSTAAEDSGPESSENSSGAQTDLRKDPLRGAFEANKGGIFLRYIYQPEGMLWQTTFDTGWQVDTGDLDTRAVSYLRSARNYRLRDWQLRPVPVLFWTQDTGSGAGFTLHTQRIFDSITSLQSTTSVNYLFDDTTYYQHGWQLIKAFSQNLRITYGINLYTSDNADKTIDEAEISATLRRRLDGEWLFFSVTPKETLKADEDYRRNFSLTFQLEAKFGTHY